MPQGRLVRMSNGTKGANALFVPLLDLGFIEATPDFCEPSGTTPPGCLRVIFPAETILPVKYIRDNNNEDEDSDLEKGLPPTGNVNFEIHYRRRPRPLFIALETALETVTTTRNPTGPPQIEGELVTFENNFNGRGLAVGFIETKTDMVDINGRIILRAGRLVAFIRNSFALPLPAIGSNVYFFLDYNKKLYFIKNVFQ